MAVSTEMSAERQARAKEYAGIRRRLYFARTVATFVVLALLVGTPLSKGVRTAIEGRAANQWLVVPLYRADLRAGVGDRLVPARGL